MAIAVTDAQAPGVTRLEAALIYLELGFSIIPINPETKRPAIKWAEYETRQPTEDEINYWFTRWPNADLAIITGEVSGLVVVDADNETALAFAEREGMTSAIRVKTRRGWHLYFAHPRDGVRRGPRAGINSRGVDWPKIPGLDFRGDGSYAVLPPSKNYRWEIPDGTDVVELAPMWRDWKPSVDAYENGTYDFDFGALDLTDVVPGPAKRVSEWERTAKDAVQFPDGKIPTGKGNGRNERVMRYASELVMEGKFGPDLRLGVSAFMREFFADPLPEREFEATCASVERMERINHPERFDAHGHYVFRRPEQIIAAAEEAAPKRRFITAADADKLVELSQHTSYFIEPWLKRGTIVQVHGYSGHGKSLFLQHCLYAMACGQRSVGPFDVAQFGRVLYLDLENGPGTIGKRLQELRALYGDPGDRFNIWTPFIDDREINFMQAATLKALEEAVAAAVPDIIVIDTVRSAWPGLKENSAEEWAKINQLALRLRNAGLAVILVHHSNKPSEEGLGREAGSTNQLTVLETQISVTQIFSDPDVAKRKAGLHAPERWQDLANSMPNGMLQMAMQIDYGKVREWTDMHEQSQWMGFGSGNDRNQRFAVGSRSLKRKAKLMALGWGDQPPLPIEQIAATLHRPTYVVRDWLEIDD